MCEIPVVAWAPASPRERARVSRVHARVTHVAVASRQTPPPPAHAPDRRDMDPMPHMDPMPQDAPLGRPPARSSSQLLVL